VASERLTAKARRRLAEHQKYLAHYEPGLQLTVDEVAGEARVRGRLMVSVGAGITRPFEIELVYHGVDPFATPDTYDPAGRFPPSLDRHVVGDGKFCLWLPQTAPNDFDLEDGLRRHLDRVREFLVLQLIYEDRKRRGIEPAWPGPIWDHGNAGHEQWLQEQLAGLNAGQLRAFSEYLQGRQRLTGKQRCPCGSGQRAGRCHWVWFNQLRKAADLYEPVRAALTKLLEEHDAIPTQ
jgi:hypothetical protein